MSILSSRSKTRVLDAVSFLFVWSCAAIVAFAFAALIWETLRQGAGELTWAFVTEPFSNFGLDGGIASMIVSTFWIVAICMAVSIPFGLGTAILLAELGRSTKSGRYIRGSLDVLAGVPSIVFGLFGNAFFCIALGMGNSILAGGLTLACMVLPILIRLTEDGIRAVPDDLGQGAAALGISRSTATFKMILPAAAPAVIAGWILGLGRALAETAALIFTAGYVSRMPMDLFDSGRSLSVHIYDMAMNVPGGNSRAYATAIVLVLMLLVINGVAVSLTRFATGRFGQVTTRGLK